MAPCSYLGQDGAAASAVTHARINDHVPFRQQRTRLTVYIVAVLHLDRDSEGIIAPGGVIRSVKLAAYETRYGSQQPGPRSHPPPREMR